MPTTAYQARTGANRDLAWMRCAPGCGRVVIAGKRELVSSSGGFLERLLAEVFEHQLRCPTYVDLRYHAGKPARSSSIKV
jgi:hypothetical protein